MNMDWRGKHKVMSPDRGNGLSRGGGIGDRNDPRRRGKNPDPMGGRRPPKLHGVLKAAMHRKVGEGVLG